MLSDFIVNFPNETFFCLNEEEWKEALKSHPELLNENSFYEKSATSGIKPTYGNYFDNDTVLFQFERFFKLVKFKVDWKFHKVVILVDNATTHSTLAIDINQFGKKEGTRCQIDFIEWDDESGVKQILSCYFDNGL